MLNNPCSFHVADIDECLTTPCGNGSCLNSNGSYACSCEPGFVNNYDDGDTCLGESHMLLNLYAILIMLHFPQFCTFNNFASSSDIQITEMF